MDYNDCSAKELDEFINILREDNKDKIKVLLNRDVSLDKEDFIALMKNTGIKFKQLYLDENDRTIGSLVFDYTDFVD